MKKKETISDIIVISLMLIFIIICNIGVAISLLSIDPKNAIVYITGFIVFSSLVFIYASWMLWTNKPFDMTGSIVVSIILLSMSIPIAYSILIAGRYLSNNGIDKIGTPDGWLGFLGAVVGGIITMFALQMTINHERKMREEDKFTNSIAYLNIESIVESEETLGSREGFMFNHELLIKNNSNVPALNFELDLKESYMSYKLLLTDNGEEFLVKAIPLNSFKEFKHRKLYIAPNSSIRFVLRLQTSTNKIESSIKELWEFTNNENIFEDFQVHLRFNYFGSYSSTKKISYLVQVLRYQMSFDECGFLEDFTTTQKDEDWTPLFIDDIIQDIKY